jgi:hypothetical protein
MDADEFQILHYYITQSKVTDDTTVLYKKGLHDLNLVLTNKDLEIQQFLIQNPNCFSFINFGVQFFIKKSVLKKRFLLGLSIIESDKKFTHLFLNSENQKWILLKFIRAFFQTFFLAIAAYILFKFKRWT